VAKSEGDIQYSVYSLNNIAEEISMGISTKKIKIMAFREMEPLRNKISANGTTVETLRLSIIWDMVGMPYGEERGLCVTFLNVVGIL
jgi:hypothetical protein